MRCRIVVVLLVGSVGLGVFVDATPLTILYTNDLHLRFERLEALETTIAAQRAEAPGLLLLDAGDTWHDFRRPTTMVSGADAMVAWMNCVGYDAMALGNHDVYWGPRRLQELAGGAEFPLLTATFTSGGGRALPFSPSTRFDVDGLPIRVIGLTTEEFFPYSAYPWLRYHPPAEALSRPLAEAAANHELTIVLAHLPVADAAAVAAQVAGIDILISGHSHETTLEPVVVNGALIVQSGAFGRNLGRLDVEVREGGGVERITHRLIPIEEAPVDRTRGLRQLARVLLALSVVVLAVLS